MIIWDNIDLAPETKRGNAQYYVLSAGRYTSGQGRRGRFVAHENRVDFSVPMSKKEIVSSKSNIQYVNLGAGYGHKTLDMNITINISSTLSIGFSPKLSVTKSGVGSGRAYSDGTVTNYYNIGN